MATAATLMWMGRVTSASGLTTNKMEKVPKHGLMALPTKVTTSMERKTETVSLNGLTNLFSKATSSITISKEPVFTNGVMIVSMKANGRTT